MISCCGISLVKNSQSQLCPEYSIRSISISVCQTIQVALFHKKKTCEWKVSTRSTFNVNEKNGCEIHIISLGNLLSVHNHENSKFVNFVFARKATSITSDMVLQSRHAFQQQFSLHYRKIFICKQIMKFSMCFDVDYSHPIVYFCNNGAAAEKIFSTHSRERDEVTSLLNQ